MKKNLALATTLFSLTQTANSSNIAHNFNVGIGLGQNHIISNHKSVENNDGGGNPDDIRNYDLAKSTLAGEISLGCGFKWNQIYIGPETSYLFTSLKRSRDVQRLSNNLLSRPTQIKSNGAFNAVLKLGYYIKKDFVGYVGGGIESRKFKIQYTVSDQPQNSINKSKNQTAFAARLGFDYSMNSKVTIGAEYRKAFYKKKIFTQGVTTLNVKPKTVDTVLLTLRYKIDFSKNTKTL